MKLLLCSWAPLSRELGTPQTLMDIGAKLTQMGWLCKVLGPQEIGLDESSDKLYPVALAQYLKKHAHEYDVIDYDHAFLPYPRSDFSKHPLLVARVQLLTHQIARHPFPLRRSLLGKIKHSLLGWKIRADEAEKLQRAQTTLEQADRIIVLNDDDKKCLVSYGITASKTAVIPNGLDANRLNGLQALSSAPPKQPRVCFIGTFDYRKGALDFPKTVSQISTYVPGTRFRLLGTRGLFKTEAQVRAFFPNELQGHLEIVPRFSPEELPKHLQDCSVGVFPSYVEGFGLGVLEMLAASIPVIAYDVPGPPMMLSKEHLVRAGDTQKMAEKVTSLLNSPAELGNARKWAHERAKLFTLEQTAKLTADFYQNALRERVKS